MRTLAVDQNNDIFADGAGELAIARDQQAAKYVCEQFARASRNEMLHKMNQGMPFFKTAFGQGSNIAQYEAAFRRRMQSIPEVIAVQEFNAEITENTLEYTATIKTQFGTVEVQNGRINIPE